MSVQADLDWVRRYQMEAADYFRNSLKDPIQFPDREGAKRGIEDTIMEEVLLMMGYSDFQRPAPGYRLEAV